MKGNMFHKVGASSAGDVGRYGIIISCIFYFQRTSGIDTPVGSWNKRARRTGFRNVAYARYDTP
jgi:hypothetical protein